MHIVEIPSFFPPYGGEFCLEQSKALRSLGHEVRIISNVQLSVKKSPKDYSHSRITIVSRRCRAFPSISRICVVFR